MQRKFGKFLRIGVATVSLTALPLVVFAQDDTRTDVQKQADPSIDTPSENLPSDANKLNADKPGDTNPMNTPHDTNLNPPPADTGNKPLPTDDEMNKDKAGSEDSSTETTTHKKVIKHKKAPSDSDMIK